MSERTPAVIVRARDEARDIGRCLELVRAQLPHGPGLELIVVDSGSTDQTVAVAGSFGARVIEIAPASFTFGGALNAGAGAAAADILVALSAHALLPDRDWIDRALEVFEDPRVACACGDRFGPEGAPLAQPVMQDVGLARAHPQWGYSNAAGAFRADLWRERPFRADLPGCEDKDWAWHWLARGYLCRVDPRLTVEHDHTHDPIASIYRRARREAHGLALALPLPDYGPRDLLREWWTDQRFYDSAARARLSHRRAARLIGSYAGRRRALRHRP